MKQLYSAGYTKIFFIFSVIVAAFAVDTLTPLGYADWLLYLFPPIIASRFVRRPHLVLLVIISTLCIIAGYFLSPLEGSVSIALVNRIAGVLTLWMLSFFIMRRAEVESSLERANREISEREERLKQTAERLSLAQRAGKASIFDWDLTTKEFALTPELKEIFGLPQGGKGYQEWAKRVDPAELPRIEKMFAEWMRSTEDEKQWEYRYLRNGEERWIAARGRIFRNHSGKPLHMVGVTVDITERVQAENKRLATESQLKAVFDAMTDGVVVFDFAGDIQMTNKAEIRLFGFSNADVMKRNINDFFKIFDWSRLDGSWLPTEERPAVRALKGESLTDLNLRVYRRDKGTEWIISFSGKPVIDQNGRQILTVLVSRDISGRYRAEEALRESEQRYSSLFNNKTIGIAHCRVITDAKGKPVDYQIVRVNPAYETITGRKKADIEGRTAREITPGIENFSFDYIGQYGKIALEGGDLSFEVCFEGTDQWLSIYAYSPIPGEFTALFSDITARKTIENSLKVSEERLRLFIEHAPAALAMFDRRMRYLRASRRWMTDYGLDERDVSGLCHYDVFPEIQERWKTVHRRALAGEVVRAEADQFDRADGTVQWLRWEVRPWYDATGNIGGIVIFSEDITERKKAEEALGEKELLLSESQRIAHIGSWSYDVKSGELLWTLETYRVYGVSPQTFKPSMETFLLILHPDDRAAMKIWINACLSGENPEDLEFRIILPGDDIRFIHGRGVLEYDAENKPIRMIGTAQDITERKKAEETIEHRTYHDLLTGLPNRASLVPELKSKIVHTRYDHKGLAVLQIDLDRFRTINESLGHSLGDRVIIEVAERLKKITKESDMLARVGSDEFIILQSELDRAEEAALFARTILDAMRKPLRIGERLIYVTASIGISMCPEDGRENDILLINADVAVSFAKESGRNNFKFFNRTLNRRTVERLLLESSLRQSLEQNELITYYQPQVNLKTGKVFAFEALVRWKHSSLGILCPSDFIPAAEEIGFISSIDEWMLRNVCAQASIWQDSGYHALPIAVNLSTHQFQQPTLVQMIKEILHEKHLAPKFLEIEITEGTAMRDINLAVPNLKGLNEIGVALSIDDFGTGYSSLNYLKRFPVHRLKIDQTFIKDVLKDTDDQAIVKAIIAMGHNLKLRVIAEGVETEDQLSFLKDNQCDEMQGYLFSEPVPCDKIEQFLITKR